MHRLNQFPRRPTVSLMVALALALPALAAAETMYVTDVLRLELQAAPTGGSEALQVLVSGTRLEILEKQRFYARVRTDSGREGWVKSGYLIDEKPAQARLQELERERDALTEQVGSLQATLSSQATDLQSAESRRQTAQLSADTSASELIELRAENGELKAKMVHFRFSVPFQWMLTIAIVALVGGFLAGLWWLDRRTRARHGGFRI